MAQKTITDAGSTLLIPGTYVNTTVKSSATNVPNVGIVTIIGEADEGKSFRDEEDLGAVAFGPGDYSVVQSRYGSGRITDAFLGMVGVGGGGAPNLIRIIKTNKSIAAKNSLAQDGVGSYADFVAKREGKPGNLIKRSVASFSSELAPESPSFAYIPQYGASAISASIRANGGVSVPISITPEMRMEDFESYYSALVDAGSIINFVTPSSFGTTLGASLAATIVSGNLVITTSGSFAASISVGDTIVIPASDTFGLLPSEESILTNTDSINIGAYTVLSISSGGNSITCVKKAGPTGMTMVAYSGTATGKDFIVYKKASIKNITGVDKKVAHGISGTFNSTITSDVRLDLPVGASWTVMPVIGDIFKVSAVFAGIKVGFYSITEVGSSYIRMTKIAPTNGSGTSGSQIMATITDLNEPFKVLRSAIPGLSKSLEIKGFSDVASIADSLIFSSSEDAKEVLIAKGSVSNSYVVGGEGVVAIGCTLENARVVIDDISMKFYVGATEMFEAPFNLFKTMTDIVDLINSEPNFHASLISNKFAYMLPANLDNGTFGISATMGDPCIIKHDVDSFESILSGDALISVDMKASAGLPDNSVLTFLKGGSKGGTSGADIVDGLFAAESLDTNIIVSLFAKDSIADIATGDTESSSSYEIKAINNLLSKHVNAMSAEKARKNRIAFGAMSGSYKSQVEAANSMSSARFIMSFMDVLTSSSDGTIVQYQPWMCSAIAAGMQVSYGYRGIFNKTINIVGVAKPEKDFDITRTSNLENALVAGLLPISRAATGEFKFVSDQTTYNKDNNFVYNSIQAMYISDLMAYTLISSLDSAAVGQSIADVNASGISSYIESILFDFLRLKWIAPSDDAPRGYKNLSVKIVGGVVKVSMDVKFASLIYFVSVNMNLTEAVQTA